MDLDSEDLPEEPCASPPPVLPAREKRAPKKPTLARTWFFPRFREIEGRLTEDFVREQLKEFGMERCARAVADMSARAARTGKMPQQRFAWKNMIGSLNDMVRCERLAQKQKVFENQLSLLLETGESYKINGKTIYWRGQWHVDGKPAQWCSFNWITKQAVECAWTIQPTGPDSERKLKDFPLLRGNYEKNPIRHGADAPPAGRRNHEEDRR